ncbi:ribosome biogenesis GTPase YlqF [Tumidithrix helvetica PCC 7403]|uniref:ribosome biogenesis GTPase YlqF n=1 Tax=Tumidithrix helvetica TaxID=3457545 RepID=UPI003CAC718F
MSSLIQWYPGHIAKAEKALLEQLKRVDVVIEVRDARIPFSSQHPKIKTWIADKSHVLVFNRVDMISESVRSQWVKWHRKRDQMVYFTDAQAGKGIKELLKAAQVAGVKINERRKSRGMLPRPVRAVVIGFPNVGKSAVINRLLNRRAAESSNRPGVTRQLRWIRISDQIELLDTPGILPPVLHDQDAALKLAICDDIGEAAYDNTLVAAATIDLLIKLQAPLSDRYGIDPLNPPLESGLDYIMTLAETDRFKGDSERVARQILHDYRKGRLGAIALELPSLD